MFIFRTVSQNMKAATWAYRHDGVCQCHAIWQTWVDENLVYLIIIISLQILFMTYLPLKVVWLVSVTQRNLFIHGGFILFIHSIHSFIQTYNVCFFFVCKMQQICNSYSLSYILGNKTKTYRGPCPMSKYQEWVPKTSLWWAHPIARKMLQSMSGRLTR